MKMLAEDVEIDFTPDLWEEHARARLVFLSASIPEPRGPDKIPDPCKRAENDRLVDGMNTEQIREAVTWIAGKALARGYTLVCGGHPAISPTILHVAMRVFADDPPVKPRVLIFQSRYFPKIDIQAETMTIARLGLGQIVRTESCQAGTPTEARDASLTLMRGAMLGDRDVCRVAPRMCAAIFIGGMYGIYEEAAIFRARYPKAPTYAIGRPGGAAASLLAGTVDPVWYETHADWASLLARDHFATAKVPARLLATAAYPVIAERALPPHRS